MCWFGVRDDVFRTKFFFQRREDPFCYSPLPVIGNDNDIVRGQCVYHLYHLFFECAGNRMYFFNVDAHELVMAGNKAYLCRRGARAIDEEPWSYSLFSCQIRKYLSTCVFSDNAKKCDCACERCSIRRYIARPSEAVAHGFLQKHRNWCLRRNTIGRTVNVFVDHEVSYDEHSFSCEFFYIAAPVANGIHKRNGSLQRSQPTSKKGSTKV